MELVQNERQKKVFTEDGRTYTMLDMGSYVGHRSRDLFDSAKEVWRLMFFDDQTSEDKKISIEALVDEHGQYMRFISSVNNTKRVLLLNNGNVYSDIIIANADGNGFGERAVALDGDIYSKIQVPLDDYLLADSEFKKEDGQQYAGDIPSKQLLEHFLKTNQALIANIESKEISLK